MKNWICGFVVLIFISIFLFACATGNSRRTSAVNGTHPQFESMCSKCHTLDRVHAAHSAMNNSQMTALVHRMAKKPGSGIHLNDIQKIVGEMY